MWLQGQLELSSWIYYMLPRMDADSHINANIISFVIGDFGVNNVVSWLGIGIFVSCFPVGLVVILQLNLDFS